MMYLSKCKEIITTLNKKLVFLMDETWKRSCQLLPSSKGFPRDKSQDMECMMNKFTYSTFRMAGGKKTAGRDLSHNLSFFIIFKMICFHRTAHSFANISKANFLFLFFFEQNI